MSRLHAGRQHAGLLHQVAAEPGRLRLKASSEYSLLLLLLSVSQPTVQMFVAEFCGPIAASSCARSGNAGWLLARMRCCCNGIAGACCCICLGGAACCSRSCCGLCGSCCGGAAVALVRSANGSGSSGWSAGPPPLRICDSD